MRSITNAGSIVRVMPGAEQAPLVLEVEDRIAKETGAVYES